MTTAAAGVATKEERQMRGILTRLVLALAVLAALVVAGCGSSSGGGTGTTGGSGGGKSVRVALVETGPKDDGGWNSNFLRAMGQMDRLAPGAQTTIVADVNPGSQGQTTLDTLATQGYDLVVSNGIFASDVAKVAPRHPDTKFLTAYDNVARDNRSAYATADEQGGYLIGMLAGMSTRSGTIGYVGNYAQPGSQRVLDGIMLGARAVRRDAIIKRLLVNSYYDPTKERQAASALADDGADVLIQDNASPASASVAEQRGLKYVGWSNDRRQQAPRAWLGGFTYEWAPIIANAANAIADGTWKPENVHLGLERGAISLLPFGTDVPKDVQAKVEQARKQLASGDLHVFTGPITDATGRVVVADGETIETPAALNSCCSWVVQGIQGQG